MVAPADAISKLVESIVDMGPNFADVATQSPITAVLVAFGALFIFASVAVFGVLTLGALVELLTPSRVGRKPSRGAR